MSATALAAIIAALEANGRIFDTPDQYGGRKQTNGKGYLAADGEFYPGGIPPWFHNPYGWGGH